MKSVWVTLGALGFVSGAAFLVFWLLAWTGQVLPGEPLAISCGMMMLVAGVLGLRRAASKTADRGKWARSDVEVGRLSALGFGVVFCAVGIAFLGFNRLPERFSLWSAGAALAGFALIWLGQTLDGRSARAGDAPDHTG